jgi:hypothetical protein
MCPAASEIQSFQDVGFLEQAHGAVNGGYADARIHFYGPLVDLLDIGMVGGFGKNTGDDPTLLGHRQAFVDAKLFYSR